MDGPRPPAKAEIVVRQGFVIDATGPNGPHAVPEVILLANADGLRFLSEVFAHLASSVRGRGTGNTVAELRLSRGEHPVNSRMSDDMDFRFAALTDANRRATLKRFGIDTRSRQVGSLFERYQEVAAQFGRLTAAMNRDQWRRDHKSQTKEQPAQVASAIAPHAAKFLAEQKLAPAEPTSSTSAGLHEVQPELTTAELPSLPPLPARLPRPSTVAGDSPDKKPRVVGGRAKAKRRSSENVKTGVTAAKGHRAKSGKPGARRRLGARP